MRTTFVVAFVSLVLSSFGSAVHSQDATKPAADRYRLPTGDVAALLKFIDDQQSFLPDTPEDALVHKKRGPIAIREAAEKILELEKDLKSEAYRTAGVIVLAGKIRSIAWITDDERKTLLADLQKLLAANEPGRSEWQLAFQIAQAFEHYQQRELARDAYRSGGEALAKSKDRVLAARGREMIGAAKRLDSIGKPMRLIGRTFSGEAFDLAAHKGKVVLVMYWSTTCGPCLAEMPELKSLHEKYKDQGFEIVGVSIDEDRTALASLLTRHPLPWTVLYDDDHAGEHPSLEEYGIFSTPTTLLIGRDGNVIELNASAESLRESLPRYLQK